jgi:glutamate formiminotransferase
MKVVQCVPNFSDGCNLETVEKIVSVLRNQPGFKLLSVEPDASYNRTVVTLLGDPEAMIEPLLAMVEKTIELIDLNHHQGEHPRMGAIDVIPFVPIQNIKMKECVSYAKRLGQAIYERFGLPVFLYEEAATDEQRVNLADIRKGEFEGMKTKIKNPLWHPDFGKPEIHPTAGAVAVGARMPLIAYNISLNTDNKEIAQNIAKTIRHSSGGLRYIKAGAVEIKEKGIVQVTMNITNYQKNSIYRVFEMVKMEATRYGVSVIGSEIVGMIPLEALTQSMEYYLGLSNLSVDKVLEYHLIKKDE